MRHHFYSSSGNTLGVEPYVCFVEIDKEGYCSRYLEVRADGKILKYTEACAADGLGQLPEGRWDEHEISKAEYGVLAPVEPEIFNAFWARTTCDNDQSLGAPK